MPEQVRVTPQMLKLLNALAEASTADRYGFELSKLTGLKSGTIYPILARLEQAGWLTSGWESAEVPGRPRRRYYRLSGEGVEAARTHLADARRRGAASRSRPVVVRLSSGQPDEPTGVGGVGHPLGAPGGPK